MDQELLDLLDDLNDVANLLKSTFVAKDELVALLVTCAVAQEHLLIVGPPGTAKSALVKRFAQLCHDRDDRDDKAGQVGYFEYLLTRFTEPNEIFGPVNVNAFREGQGARRDTQQMLPQAEMAFLDEVFKGNSAILNALLTLLNERVFYNGKQREEVPLILVVGATNNVPDDASLAALYDRFLLRVFSDNVSESLFSSLFERGWQLEKTRIEEGYKLSLDNVISTDDLRLLHRTLGQVDLSAIAGPYREVVRRIRAEGIYLSDRRVVKLLKLIAASALCSKRLAAHPGDFWVLRYVWNEPSQLSHLQAIIEPYLQEHGQPTPSNERSRSLAQIEDDVVALEQRYNKLRTDTDYLDFLQRIEAQRRELMEHPSATNNALPAQQTQQQALLQRVESTIDGLMERLSEGL